MELKDLFDPGVKKDILDRINKLTPQSQPKVGQNERCTDARPFANADR